MKKSLIHSNWLLILAILFISCSKGGDSGDDGGGGGVHVDTPNDVTAPDLSIFTPVASQVFSNGNVIKISGRVTDDYGLYRGTIKVVNDANGFLLVNQPYEIHGYLVYNFELNHTASAGAASDYTITVSFEDHGANTVTKSVKVKVNP